MGGDALFADNLFRFGDKDGSGTGAQLQHPLAVLALPSGQVVVADSYNHKLKVSPPHLHQILCSRFFHPSSTLTVVLPLHSL